MLRRCRSDADIMCRRLGKVHDHVDEGDADRGDDDTHTMRAALAGAAAVLVAPAAAVVAGRLFGAGDVRRGVVVPCRRRRAPNGRAAVHGARVQRRRLGETNDEPDRQQHASATLQPATTTHDTV